ncbi:uncharacterized protein TRIADDRAFT_59681 [Trichoplax adhaerens]|uniref:Transmembrane protein n=1 Tax=Trichoplax adhaerens TaxID=10228 RepID=B3S655_TRIAD|nr:predicted protein [Trichoplax adhaerens]EDV21563.1 predicted protein [Trichoplax adhaerens]|eukprot:XP_002115711.1 predicted protein [Trichoplax adhaerens]
MAMSSTAVAGASLMIFGLGDVAISILVTVDINSTIRYYGSISFLLMISSVLGTSMILGGLMCIIQHRFHKGMAKQSLQLSDFGEQRREQDEPLDAGGRVETAESLADVFILQGLYATQTCLTGIFLLLAAGCGYLHEIRHINGAAAWSCVFFYISRLISIAAIGINITIFTNVRATYLNYHFSALAVFILSTIFMATGFLLSVYAAYVFKLRINKQTVHICPICLNASNSSLQLVFVWTGHFQFLSGLALWTVGLAAMIFNIFEHSSLHTFYLASLLLTTSRFASATNKNQSEAQDVEELVESNMPDCTTSDDKDMGNDN